MKFWNKGKDAKFYTFNKLELAKYLQSIGIFRYYTTTLDWILVRIIDNIVDYIDIATIKHLVIEYVKMQKDDWLLDNLQYNISKLINEVSVQLIERKDIEFFEGEKDVIYIFFSDLIAVVTDKEITSILYKDFHKNIWKSAILERMFPDETILTDTEPGVFEQFFNNVLKDSNNNSYARHVFGYALQRYRNLSNMRAIILSDDNIDDQAKGGTGKGLFVQALSQFLKTVKENGKAYRSDRAFSFQNIGLDTRLCFIDDVPIWFDITGLFSVITEGMYIERKKKQPFYIQAKNAPMFIFSTNYGLKGADDSHIRRRYDIGIDKHYTPKFTPEHEFKHQLFREWDTRPNEWIKFDVFMLECAYLFMCNGVTGYENPKLKEKQFSVETHPDFYDYMVSKLNYNTNETTLKKDDVVDDLRRMTGNPKFTKTRATQWIKRFTELENIMLENDRKNNLWILNGTHGTL